mgnify:CR=1 FL=1
MFDPFVIQAASAPTQSTSGIPVRQVIHILDAAVFPIPISPKLITLLPLSWQSVTNVGSISDGQFHFILCHGCFIQEVAGPFPDFPVDQLWDGREIEIHTTVDYLDFEAVLA